MISLALKFLARSCWNHGNAMLMKRKSFKEIRAEDFFWTLKKSSAVCFQITCDCTSVKLNGHNLASTPPSHHRMVPAVPTVPIKRSQPQPQRRNTNAGLAGISPVLSKFEALHLSRVFAGVIHIPQLSCFCEQRFGGWTLKHHKLHRLLRIETQ